MYIDKIAEHCLFLFCKVSIYSLIIQCLVLYLLCQTAYIYVYLSGLVVYLLLFLRLYRLERSGLL